MNGRTAKIPHEMTIKQAANGGYIVRHSYDNSMSGPSYQPPTEHAFSTHEEATAHVQKHMKLGKLAGEYETRPAGVGQALRKGSAPTRRTYGAGAD